MGFICGLAVILVIFEGIIIQCDGAPRRKRNTTLNDMEEDLPILPNDLIELIISKTDFGTIREILQSKKIRTTDIIMSRILQDHIIVIEPEMNEKICETDRGGITIRNYDGLASFFAKFGDKVKKIEIQLGYIDSPRMEITQNLIKTYAKTIDELRIDGFHLDSFWNGILDGENGIIFPEVKKFRTVGSIERNEFKLKLIFPNIESVELNGLIADVNCLANVTKLNELILYTDSIEEHQLDDIFAKNKNMSMICLSRPVSTETWHSIVRHLTKLKTLALRYPGINFMVRANNNAVYKLPSVTQLCITFGNLAAYEITNLSFDMPNLKELTLIGHVTDNRIVNLINYFEKLEIVEVSVESFNAVKCIENWKNIKEFRTACYRYRFRNLKTMFETFNKESKLQTVKFLDFSGIYREIERNMTELNVRLETAMKPKWTISHEVQIGTGNKYLMFKREDMPVL